jgi:hypothetical protein
MTCPAATRAQTALQNNLAVFAAALLDRLDAAGLYIDEDVDEDGHEPPFAAAVHALLSAHAPPAPPPTYSPAEIVATLDYVRRKCDNPKRSIFLEVPTT